MMTTMKDDALNAIPARAIPFPPYSRGLLHDFAKAAIPNLRRCPGLSGRLRPNQETTHQETTEDAQNERSLGHPFAGSQADTTVETEGRLGLIIASARRTDHLASLICASNKGFMLGLALALCDSLPPTGVRWCILFAGAFRAALLRPGVSRCFITLVHLDECAVAAWLPR